MNYNGKDNVNDINDIGGYPCINDDGNNEDKDNHIIAIIIIMLSIL